MGCNVPSCDKKHPQPDWANQEAQLQVVQTTFWNYIPEDLQQTSGHSWLLHQLPAGRATCIIKQFSFKPILHWCDLFQECVWVSSSNQQHRGSAPSSVWGGSSRATLQHSPGAAGGEGRRGLLWESLKAEGFEKAALNRASHLFSSHSTSASLYQLLCCSQQTHHKAALGMDADKGNGRDDNQAAEVH